MKRFLVPFVLLVGIFSCSKGTEEVPTMDSVIEIDPGIVEVEAAGGTYTVSYSITDPAEDGVIETPICTDGWCNQFDVSEPGVISFNVDPNTVPGERRTEVTVLYSNAEEPAVFTVIQADPTKVLASDLDNTLWTAEVCEFDRDSTIFRLLTEYNELSYQTITAGEFADQYAIDYNMANPDSPISPDDALGFQFIDTPEYRSYANVLFGGNQIEFVHGSSNPVGGVEVTDVSGPYVFDESTGIITVNDKSNTNYEREVTIHVSKDGDYLLFRIIKTWWPETIADYYGGDKPYLGFNVTNYNGTQAYCPYGYLLYRMKLSQNEDEQ